MNRFDLRRMAGLALAVAMTSVLAVGPVSGICLEPPGDVSGDGLTTVIDVQCSILMNLWSLSGQTGPVPGCIQAPGSPAVVADHNCDGVLNVADTLVAVSFALSIPLNLTVDANENQCVDACESDLDGDGDFDLSDCAPVDPAINSSTSEVCNGFDDDCDGLIDESTPGVTASCSDSDVCNGQESCGGLPAGLNVMISEIMVDPEASDDIAGEWIELFNPTDSPVNIKDWILTNEAGNTHTINPGGALFIPPNGIVLLARSGGVAANGGVLANYVYTGFSMPNASGKIVLFTSSLNLVDRVEYDASTWPIAPGASMALTDATLDNNDPSAWALSSVPYGDGDLGTPRGANRDVAVAPCDAGTALTCDDGNDCTDDSCDAAAGCVTADNTVPCDDGDACTEDDVCSGGSCGGTAVDCDDSEACTTDSCDPSSGCVNAPLEGEPCSDGDACTEDDACDSSGSCAPGAPAECDDGNPCTDTGCDPATGCTSSDNTAACDDGNACTENDVCAAGTCSGDGIDCDDGEACTDDSCDPASGCVNAPLDGQACDDSDACTTGETCTGGSCGGGSTTDCDDDNECTDDSCDSATGCINADNTVPCDDGDACTEGDQCAGGSCEAGSDLDCDDENPCTSDTCVPSTGCLNLPEDGALCDDGDACTADDVCAGGTCAGPTATICNDGIDCTADSCDPASGCVFAPNDAVCEDGDPCTADTCDPASGCTQAPVLDGACAPLPEAAFCGVAGLVGDTVRCTLRIARSSDSTPAPAAVQFAINYDPAQVKALRFVDEVCVGGGAVCLDQTVPPANIYPQNHSLAPVPADISTWNGIGSASLFNLTTPTSALSTAYYTGVTFTGGDTAFVDLEFELVSPSSPTDPEYVFLDSIVGSSADATKLTGSVIGGVMVLGLENCADIPGSCDDGDPCSVDTCNADSGSCEYAPLVCSDNDACNGLEVCSSLSGCVPGVPLDCDDGLLCTDDSCNPVDGCQNTPVDCSDGNPCNGDESCHPTFGCQANPALDCDDGDPCTIDSCDAGSGCVYVPNPAAECLPPGLFCGVSGEAGTIVDCPIRMARANLSTPTPASAQFQVAFNPAFAQPVALMDEICVGPGGTPPCIPAMVPPGTLVPTGHQVVAVPNDVTNWGGAGDVVIFNSDNPSAAITPAYAIAGAILGDSSILNLRVELTTDIPAGAPHYLAFEEIKAATAGAAAMVGEVVNGTMVLSLAECGSDDSLCDDGNACTVDACIAGVCSNTALTCDDGDACNGAETCNPGIGCVAGAPLDCDDGEVCTTDSCDAATGCVTTPVDCDDGNACNGAETCTPGTGCTAGAPLNCDDGDACTTDACVESLGCQYSPVLTDACLPEGALCGLTGSAGEDVTCVLRLTRLATATPAPVSAQFDLSWDSTVASATGFTDEQCVGPGGGEPCFPAAVPPGGLSPTGHSLTPVPADIPGWPGAGSVAVFKASAPLIGITDAAYNGGSVAGDPAFVEFDLTLSSDAPGTAPLYVYASDIVGSTPAAQSMSGWVAQGVMVLQVADCAIAPEACNDSNPCTVDACDDTTGTCVYTAKVCDDGDACNGIETCDPSDGECIPDFPLNCDDGNACTTDACVPAVGCTATPVVCDDGDPCNGIEDCDAATGCTAGDALVCDDGDDCTIDSCDPAAGCVHTPDVDSGCLPNGAFCAVSGSAGDTVECSVQLARASQDTPLPAGAQFEMTYDAAAVAPLALLDTICLGPGGTPPCVPQSVPPATLQPSGHQAVLIPSTFGEWTGSGSVLLFNVADPSSILSTAYLAGVSVVGDTEIATLSVDLLSDVDATSPSYLYYGEVKGTTADAQAMVGTVADGTMVLAAASCVGVAGACNDGNACTIDICDFVTESCTYEPVACDDSDVCNGAETCDPATGCQAGAALDCDDSDACTTDACDAEAGCSNAPLACDDGDACNGVETCDSATGCVDPPDLDCDDSEPCTVDACDPGLGCVYGPTDCSDGDVCNGFETCESGVGCQSAAALDCDDGDACTTDACDASAGCIYTPLLTLECLPEGAVCGVAGAAGEQVSCPLNLARATMATPVPASAQFTLSYNNSMLDAVGMTDEFCVGGGPVCVPLTVPPDALSPSGHTVAIVPATFDAWMGMGDVAIFNPSTPTSSVTDAYLSAGSALGETQFVEFIVELQADVAATSPMYVWASDVKGASAIAQPLSGETNNGLMVLELVDCNDDASVCSDGNPCTVDTCDSGSGQCVYAPINCSDGDLCNGIEACDAATGACVAGTAPDCDDGNACTDDTCDPDFGCQFAAIVCDDGDPCNGLETCNAGSCDDGTALVCDDGDDCTVDSCTAGTGCTYAPSLEAACLPDSVLCGIVGAAGTEAVCDLSMARDNIAVPAIASAQFDLSWDASRADLTGFKDVVCFGPGGGEPCLPADVPPQGLYPTGHTVVLVPDDPAAWNGSGSFVAFQTPGLTDPLTMAYFTGDALTGDADFAEMHITLTEDVPATAPIWVVASEITASSQDAIKLVGATQGGVMRMALEDCSGTPESCDDAEPCTTDICVDGACVYTPTVCDDGDVCTGAEACIDGVGCATGAPLDCDDGTACTVDTCDPTLGCIHTLVVCDDGDACNGLETCDPSSGCVNPPDLDCDDGDACTEDWCTADAGCQYAPVDCQDGDACNGAEGCDPATGCTAPAETLDCDDGDACTVDSCEAATGCVYVPSLAAACLPADVCCGLVGSSGEAVTCTLLVARDAQASPTAAGLQVDLGYDGSVVTLDGFEDEVCFGPGGTAPCLPSAVPPGSLSSGHSATLIPDSLEDWTNGGSLVLFNLTDPSAPLTDAYLDAGGDVQGEPAIIEALFSLDADVDASAPVWVQCSEIVGTTATAAKMVGTADGGVMVLTPE